MFKIDAIMELRQAKLESKPDLLLLSSMLWHLQVGATQEQVPIHSSTYSTCSKG